MNQENPSGSKSSINWAGCALRAVLVLGTAFLGLVIGSNLAARFWVPKNQGLAGPFEVLFYGALFGLGAGALALALCFFLKGKALKITSLLVAISSLILLVIMGVLIQRNKQARLDPETAYAGIPEFSVSLEQLVIKDPYLRVKIEVDAKTRKWRSVGPAPENQNCRGGIRAKILSEIAAGLEAATSEKGQQTMNSCRVMAVVPDQRLVWSLADGSNGSLEFGQACLDKSPDLARLVRALNRATLSPVSPIKCD